MDFLDSLNPNTPVITPTKRLAAYILEKSPHDLTVFSYDTWLSKTWNALSARHNLPLTLLNTFQIKALWESIIRDDTRHEPLLNVATTANQAIEAYERIKAWHVDTEHPHFHYHQASAAFKKWMHQFEAHCQQRQWITLYDVPTLLIKHIDLLKTELPAIHYVGFIEFSPQQQQLLDALRAANIALHITSTINHFAATTSQLAFNHRDHEIETMAAWARHYSTNATVACIVPTLESERATIERIFSRVCGQHAYNISAALPLNSYPIIFSALQALSLNNREISLGTLSHILRSPYFSHPDDEQYPRVLTALLSVNKTSFSAKEIMHFLKENTTPHFFYHALQSFFKLSEGAPSALSLHDWSKLFSKQLESLQWPGNRSLNSHEYQCIERLKKLILEYHSLAKISEKMTLAEALYHLNSLCHGTLFQPESPATRIQVLSLLEGPGITFDKVWIMDATDKIFPGQPKPNAFIPFALQRQLRMPHCDSQKEFQLTQILLEQYCKSNTDIIFSFAHENGDEIQRPSYFIRTLNPITLDTLKLPTPTSLQIKNVLEPWMDNKGPAVTTHTISRGGSTLLKRQAQCPFRAFAEYRLHLTPQSQPEPGIPSTLRGMLLHRSLELFWKTIKSQDNLLKLPNDELSSRVHAIIEEALKDFNVNYYSDTFLQIEKTRLHLLLQDWLTLEKSRPAFTVIACEKESSITLEGLTLTVRIDRIDQLNDGTLMLIDYKTSNTVDIKEWFGERPLEPQLPLYSLQQANLQAISYAQVNRDELGFKGIANNQETTPAQLKTLAQLRRPDAKENWSEQQIHWKTTLSQLANDYQQGVAHVHPKNKAQCDYCQLHSLCRIHEAVEI